MSAKQVKDVMIPVENYVTVSSSATMGEVFLALEADRAAKGGSGHAHRDVLVVDADGGVIGKVTMLDVFGALEPGYRKIREGKSAQTLSADYVAKVYEEFDLWSESLASLCAKGASVTVSEMMHVPGKMELLDESADLERAVHHYIMGAHQPLLATRGGRVVGVVRLGDVFEVIRNHVLNCKAE